MKREGRPVRRSCWAAVSEGTFHMVFSAPKGRAVTAQGAALGRDEPGIRKPCKGELPSRLARPFGATRSTAAGDARAAPWALTARPVGANSVRPGLVALLLLIASTASAQETVRLACSPRTFEVVPGEPVRVELTVETDSAAPIRLHVPADPLLRLRAVEKQPLRRTKEGTILHKRVVLWQALEPGSVRIDAISVETRGKQFRFPAITITVRDPGP